MSPIIYTPHECEPPTPQPVECPMLSGTLWQCPECDKVWMLDSVVGIGRINVQWFEETDPRRDVVLQAANASAARATEPATLVVTPEMVQLVLDTYTEHSELGHDDSGDYAECAECGTGSYGPHTIQAHAAEEATSALQGALAAGEQR